MKKRQGRAEGGEGREEGREGGGGRVETGFSITFFAPLPLSPDPHYALFSHNEGAEYKRGSVRQKLVWVAMHSIMVGSESSRGTIVKEAVLQWLEICFRIPNDVTMYKVEWVELCLLMF